MSDEHYEIMPEIREMILDAARKAVKTTSGNGGTGAPATAFETMTHLYGGRHPVPDLLREMLAAAEEHSAKRAGTLPPDYSDPDKLRVWNEAVQHSADQARDKHFQKAQAHFTEGRDAEAAEELCRAINCQLAAIAASKGWPHRTPDDIDNAVTALATGKLPKDGSSIREMLESASETGDELNSAFAAARAQPSQARDRLFHDSHRDYREDSTSFAERTIELARLLAGETQ